MCVHHPRLSAARYTCSPPAEFGLRTMILGQSRRREVVTSSGKAFVVHPCAWWGVYLVEASHVYMLGPNLNVDFENQSGAPPRNPPSTLSVCTHTVMSRLFRGVICSRIGRFCLSHHREAKTDSSIVLGVWWPIASRTTQFCSASASVAQPGNRYRGSRAELEAHVVLQEELTKGGLAKRLLIL